MTKPQFVQLVVPNPHLNGVFRLDAGIKKLAAELKKFNPDVVVDLHHNLRTRILKTLIGGTWLAFNKLNVEKWLQVKLKVNRLPDVHIVDRYLETVRSLDIESDGKGLDYFFPKDFKTPEIPTGFETGFIALVVGAKLQTKQLPAHKLVELCNGMQKPIVLIGGPEDGALASAVITRSHANVYDACGAFSIAQSAWMLKQADAVITHDTGMMHIAAAFNKNIISVWGNTIPAFGMYPYLPENGSSFISEVNGLDCRPCSKIGYAKCPKGHFKCMEEQDIAKIIMETNETLRSSG